jgi:hypothetical protein
MMRSKLAAARRGQWAQDSRSAFVSVSISTRQRADAMRPFGQATSLVVASMPIWQRQDGATVVA